MKRLFLKSLVGIASTWSKVTPCNMHINELADLVESSIDSSGCKGVLFLITVSDGISMGTQGMKFSLVSREVIADSIETVVGCLIMMESLQSVDVIRICLERLWD